jgi:hypothetical protein
MPKIRLVKLTDADLTLNVAPPALTQTAADTLQNDMTGADGFDAIFQAMASDVSYDQPWVEWWVQQADAADFQVGWVDSAVISPLVSDFALFAASGDAQAADLDSTLTGQAQSPTPPPVPTISPAPVTTAPAHGPTGPTKTYTTPGFTTVVYYDIPNPSIPYGGFDPIWGDIPAPSEK